MAYFPNYIYLDPYCHLHDRSYSSKYTEAFEREIQPRKMIKSLCESVAVL